MKISNSQIMSFQKCEKRFYFEHILKLKPKSYPEPMEKGLSGHDMMELFFRKMKEGASYEECVEAINPHLEACLEAGQHFKIEVYRHVLAFGAYVFANEWKPVQVEDNSLYPVTNFLEFAFTIDCIFEWTKGPKKGRKFAIDFKFTGQYWNDRELNMFQQGPKYLIYTNKMHEEELSEHKITAFAVIMLNTRAGAAAAGTGLFQVKWLNISKKKLETVQGENEVLMHRIAYAKNNYTPEMYLRTVDSHQCKMCWFADDLCPMDLEGRDTHRVIERSYEINTYFDDNYNKGLTQ